MIVELASVFAILGKRALKTVAKERISRWFWSVVLGELFDSSTDTSLARDVPDIVNWIDDKGGPPQSISEAVFLEERFHSLRSRNAAAYKGIHALLMRHGCRDFVQNVEADIMTFFDYGIDIHHIFPRAWCEKQQIDSNRFNSIVNKTMLFAGTNKEVGGNAPSVYLRKIEKKHGVSQDVLDDILRSHLIEPRHLRADDFESFFQARRQALSKIVSEAMGKTVVTEVGSNEPEFGEDPEDNGVAWEV